MVLIIDNYDSFTYNLYQAIAGIIGSEALRVVRNDQITPDQAEELSPTHILISPGPGTPAQAGSSGQIIRRLMGKVPILGICLGHQCIADAFDARIVRANRIVHGKTDLIHHHRNGIYSGLPNPFTAARYHSLIIEPGSLSGDFDVTSWTADDEIMGIRHKSMPLEGVQFHPESYMSEQGNKLLRNFLRRS